MSSLSKMESAACPLCKEKNNTSVFSFEDGLGIKRCHVCSHLFTSLRLDEVALWHVLEHLETPSTTLETLHSLLVENGMIFITVPNAESGNARRGGAEWPHLQPQVHLQNFTQNTLRTLLDNTGFNIIDSFKSGGTGVLENRSKCPAGLKRFAIRRIASLSWLRKPLKYAMTNWLGHDDFITVIGKRK